MAALDYLRRSGLAVELEGDRLRVTPTERITGNHRQYLRAHRAELLVELSAANDCPAPAADLKHSQLGGYILTAATASPDWRQARDQYINHLMICRACYAPTGRYCATGADLRQRYSSAPMEPTL